MLITFAHILDPDQGHQNVGTDLDQNCWILMQFLKAFFDKFDFEKKTADDKKHSRQRVKGINLRKLQKFLIFYESN